MTDWRAQVGLLREGARPDGAICVYGDASEGVFRIGGAAVKLAAIEDAASIAQECVGAAWASAVGVGPEVIAALPEDGALVTRFLAGGPVTAGALRAPALLQRVAVCVRAIHAGPPLAGTQDLRGDLAYEREGSAIGFEDLEQAVWDAVSQAPVRVCPCHNDLHPGNLFDVNGAVQCIDWAAAAMGDPAWDVAMLGSSAHFEESTWGVWLAAYGATTSFGARARLLGIIADLYNLAWYVNHRDTAADAITRHEVRLRAAHDRFEAWRAQL